VATSNLNHSAAKVTKVACILGLLKNSLISRAKRIIIYIKIRVLLVDDHNVGPLMGSKARWKCEDNLDIIATCASTGFRGLGKTKALKTRFGWCMMYPCHVIEWLEGH